jgi:hypothetical protein
MLSAHEFTVGTIGQATPLTLVMPRYHGEESILIAHAEKGPAAFFLSGGDRFRCFESTGNDAWRGLLVPDVRIEVDVKSVFSPDYTVVGPGSVTRENDGLYVVARGEGIRVVTKLTLETDLAPASATAAFSRWSIVLGEGTHKHVLHEVNMASPH